MTNFWQEKRVLITGGAGFVGSHVVARLQRLGCGELVVPRRADCDLRNLDEVIRLFDQTQPHIVMHLAATVGGIGANRAASGQFFYDNALMGLHIIEQARRARVEKLVCLGSVCAYPKFTPVPFQEDALWNGYPEETNAPYGLAKRMTLVQLQAYREQYGLNGIYLIPTNLYGPHDHFDLEASHVVPALVRRFIEAKLDHAPAVTLWGTGNVSRDFLYVEDAAEAIVLATQLYNDQAPLNLGSGHEVRIADLATIIKELVAYPGTIHWDTTKPDGQPRRCVSSERVRHAFGWQSTTSLTVGLQYTIDWYLTHATVAS